MAVRNEERGNEQLIVVDEDGPESLRERALAAAEVSRRIRAEQEAEEEAEENARKAANLKSYLKAKLDIDAEPDGPSILIDDILFTVGLRVGVLYAKVKCAGCNSYAISDTVSSLESLGSFLAGAEDRLCDECDRKAWITTVRSPEPSALEELGSALLRYIEEQREVTDY